MIFRCIKVRLVVMDALVCCAMLLVRVGESCDAFIRVRERGYRQPRE